MERHETNDRTRGTKYNGVELQKYIVNSEKAHVSKITNVNVTSAGNMAQNIKHQLIVPENEQILTKEKGQVAHNHLHFECIFSAQLLLPNKISYFTSYMLKQFIVII